MWSLKVTLYWLDMYLSAIIGDIGFSVVCISIMSHSHASQEYCSHTIRKSFVNVNGGAEWAAVEMRNSFWGLGVCLLASKKPLESGASKHKSNWVTLYHTHSSISLLWTKHLFFYMKLSIQLPSSIFVGKEGMITMEQVERADIQQTLNQTSARLVQRYSTR